MSGVESYSDQDLTGKSGAGSQTQVSALFFFKSSFKDMFSLIVYREKKGEKEREKH